MLSQCNDPLLLLELGVACHQELLANLSSFKNDLKCILPLGSLFINFFDVEVIKRVEFSRVIVSVLLGIEIDDTSIGNDAEFFGPFVSFEHALSAFPDQANPDTFNVNVLHNHVNKTFV
jgi:hypothetical protein